MAQTTESPTPPTKAEHRRAIIAAGAAMLLVERASRRSMGLALGAAIRLSARRGPEVTTALVVASQAKAIARARKVARERASLAFRAQTSLARIQASTSAEAFDLRRAEAAARALGDRFGGLVERARAAKAQAVEPGTTYRYLGRDLTPDEVRRYTSKRSAESLAAEDLAPALDRTASTEVPAAWNDEWRRTARYYSERGVPLVHEWNAEADACEKCFVLHGEIVHDDEQFPEGDPPIHPRCRCRIDTHVEN